MPLISLNDRKKIHKNREEFQRGRGIFLAGQNIYPCRDIHTSKSKTKQCVSKRMYFVKIWNCCIALHAAPRFLFAYMYKQYFLVSKKNSTLFHTDTKVFSILSINACVGFDLQKLSCSYRRSSSFIASFIRLSIRNNIQIYSLACLSFVWTVYNLYKI